MGVFMARDLVKSGFDVTIGDMNEAAGQALVKELGSKASFRMINVRETDTLVEMLKDYMLVVNNIGPYFEYGGMMPQAALQAGVNYVDICDDYDATELILNMHKKVEREGLVFRTGFGSSPGITNVMARIGASKLDTVESIKLCWFVDTGETIGLGQLMHWTHIAMGKVPMHLDGKKQWVNALSEREVIRFPEPAGRVTLYYTGHPEPVSIPRYLEVDNVICKGGTRPESDIDITRALGKQLTFPLQEAPILKFICKVVLDIMPLFQGNVEERVVLAANRVEVAGRQQDRNLQYVYGISGPEGPKTANPTSITAQMIINGDIKTPGVFPPEGCPDLDVEKFVKELAARNITFTESREKIEAPKPTS
jgi:lysine 6-dehydrogenase